MWILSCQVTTREEHLHPEEENVMCPAGLWPDYRVEQATSNFLLRIKWSFMWVIFNRRTLSHSDLQIRQPWLRPVWAVRQKLLASIISRFISEWMCLGRMISNTDWSAGGVSVEVATNCQKGKQRAEWSYHGATSNKKSKESLLLSLIQYLQAT